MGKPIAGQNQFPYTIGGFLVDGANINGVTYAKKLYIHKQRSYNTYDLMDVSGNIYRFIKIGYRDTDGNKLNYFDVDEDLVETIPENTFFLKIQDPSRNIFSFVRIYQWHKCITVDGDYVFRTADIDPRLSGVLINPAVSTLQVGSSFTYKSLFYPSNYPDTDGNWYVNAFENNDSTDIISLSSSTLNSANVKANLKGKAILSFVPSSNDTLVSHSIINVVEEDLALEFFEVFPVENYNSYQMGENYTLEVVTYPYDYVLTSPLQVKIMDDYSYADITKTELVSVSDDFKKYTFNTSYTGDVSSSDPDTNVDANVDPTQIAKYISFQFTMTDPIEYQFEYSSIGIFGSNYYSYYFNSPSSVIFNLPPKLRPNMTYTAPKSITGPNTQAFPYVSSDDAIATFDVDTGTITTHGKLGTVMFSTQIRLFDGTVQDVPNIMSVQIMDEVYDLITREPAEKVYANRGEEIQYKFVGYREGYEPYNIPVRSTLNAKVYSVSNDGLITVSSTAATGQTVYAWPTENINIDTQLLYIYKSPGTSLIVQDDNADIPMTGMDITDTLFLRFDEPNGSIMAYPVPRNTTAYQMEFESYDDTVIEIIDEDFLLNNFQYSMGGTLMPYFKPLKRGSTELIIRSVANPDVKASVKIIIY